MPLPRFQSSPRVGRNAPREVNPLNSTAAEGQAVQQVGQAVRQVAGTGLNIANQLDEKRKRAEIQSFGDNMSRKLRMEASEFALQDKAQRANTDFRGHEEAVKGFIDERIDSIIAESPGEESSGFFRQKVAAFRESTILKSRSDEFLNRARFFKAERAASINQQATFFNINPDPFRATTELKRIKEENLKSVGTEFSSKQEALNEFKDAQSKIRQAVFSGLIRDGLPASIVDRDASPEVQRDQIRRFLQSEDNEILLEGLTPRESNQFLTRAVNSIKVKNGSNLSEIRSLTSNAVNELIKGTVNNPNIRTQIDGLFSRIQALPASETKNQLLSDIMNAKLVGEKTEELKFLSKDEILETDINSIFPTENLSESRSDSKMAKLLASRASSLLKERENDGRAFADSVFSGLSDLESVKVQESLGIANTRVLTKQQSFQQAETILSLPSARDRSLALTEFIASRDTSLSHKAINELINDNPNFGSEYLVASYLTGQQSKESVIRNGSRERKKEINDLFKGQGNNSELLNVKIADRLRQDLQVLSQSELGFLGASLLESVNLESKRLVTQGESVDSAVLRAKKLIIDDNFDFYQDDDVKAIVPKSIPISSEQIELFSDIALNKDFLMSQGVSSKRFARGISEEEFLDLVSEEAVWVTSADGTGLELKMANRNTGELAVLANQSGADIKIDFMQIPEFLSNSQETIEQPSFVDPLGRGGIR